MNILLDECIPRRFKFSLSVEGHTCTTVAEEGFAGKKNGELLTLAASRFDVFVTLDKGIEYQQNLGNRSIAVIVIQSRSSRLSDLQRHADACLRAMRDIEKGELVRV